MDKKNIPMFKPYTNKEKALQLISESMDRGWIGEGPKVNQFERELCAKFGFKFIRAVNSGTSALRLALVMAGVGPLDEVLSTANTCTATNTAILEQFAVPVFADIQYLTGNVDPQDIKHRITARTKAIMCVHWAGYPCDLDEIHAVANRHGLHVIEDAAHAQGATYKGAPIGTISPFTCFSYQAIKTLTTADGGGLAVLTEAMYEEAYERSWFGINRDKRRRRDDGYWFWNQVLPGFKYHMNDVSASIGLANLEHFDRLYEERRAQAGIYRRCLAGVPGVTLFDCQPDRTSGHWLFTMHVERRDDFCRMMRERGVEASVVHIRNDVHGVFGPRRRDLPQLDRYELTQVSIPIGWWVSLEDQGYIIECIRGGW